MWNAKGCTEWEGARVPRFREREREREVCRVCELQGIRLDRTRGDSEQ